MKSLSTSRTGSVSSEATTCANLCTAVTTASGVDLCLFSLAVRRYLAAERFRLVLRFCGGPTKTQADYFVIGSKCGSINQSFSVVGILSIIGHYQYRLHSLTSQATTSIAILNQLNRSSTTARSTRFMLWSTYRLHSFQENHHV